MRQPAASSAAIRCRVCSRGGVNPYVYARDNPIRHSDPTGRWPDTEPDEAALQAEREAALIHILNPPRVMPGVSPERAAGMMREDIPYLIEWFVRQGGKPEDFQEWYLGVAAMAQFWNEQQAEVERGDRGGSRSARQTVSRKPPANGRPGEDTGLLWGNGPLPNLASPGDGQDAMARYLRNLSLLFACLLTGVDPSEFDSRMSGPTPSAARHTGNGRRGMRLPKLRRISVPCILIVPLICESRLGGTTVGGGLDGWPSG